MISSVVPFIDTILGLSLVAAAAAIHFRPRRHRGHRVRVRVRVPGRPHHLHIRPSSLPVPLATAGVTLIVAGWLWQDEAPTLPAAARTLYRLTGSPGRASPAHRDGGTP